MRALGDKKEFMNGFGSIGHTAGFCTIDDLERYRKSITDSIFSCNIIN
jgi:hypothetical protein